MTTGKSYIGCANDTKGAINSNQFKLGAGMHRNKNLQSDWKKYGEFNFSVKVLETLSYDNEDEAKTDYTKELEVLCDKWINSIKKSENI